jgi:hypothetical protein
MAADSVNLKWSAQYTISTLQKSKTLAGDKIILPPNALEQLLAAATTTTVSEIQDSSHDPTFDPYNPYSFATHRRAGEHYTQQQQLPHPLTFRLVDPENGRVVYAGIREFSAEEDEIQISPFLRHALGLEDEIGATATNGDHEMINAPESQSSKPRLTVHAQQIPKGTYVRLRPLEPGYDPEDWKALLEQYLRANFTTLTNGELLTVPGQRLKGDAEEFRFLVDKLLPEGDAICIVDTDLEVDIEALNEDQARETLKRRLAKLQRAPGTTEGSALGGKLDLNVPQEGQIRAGEYVDYQLATWDISQSLVIDIETGDNQEIDVFVSPYSSRYRSRPRQDEHIFSNVSSQYPKSLQFLSNDHRLEGAEAIWISIFSYLPNTSDQGASKSISTFSLHVSNATTESLSAASSSASKDVPPNPGEIRCTNCLQWVPERTMMLHENFCLRNNVRCSKCDGIFKKSSPEWKNHWHCPHDSEHGNTLESEDKHNNLGHAPRVCSACSYEAPNMELLSEHKTTTCPAKIILCQFCHLEVPQEADSDGPNGTAFFSGLTPHELADGARTTECNLCNKIVRLRDMNTHLKHHEIGRSLQTKPQICRNANCGRTLYGVGPNGKIGNAFQPIQHPGNEIGLCKICFGPLYVSTYDPEGKALQRRVERRYLTQLLTGCKQVWCQNEFCKNGRQHRGLAREDEQIATKDALPMIKLYIQEMRNQHSPLHFCVNESNQRKRDLAEVLVTENKGEYDLEWCIAAMEAAGDYEPGKTWLHNWAPKKGDSMH